MGTKLSSSSANRTFAQIPRAEIQRSKLDRSHAIKTTIDAGFIYPFLVDEALPGDTLNLNATLYGRLATPFFPVMDNMTLDTFFFAVPMRLLWDNWQKFNGEQIDPGDSTDFTIPTITSGGAGFLEGSLSDYLTLPTKTPNALTVSALFHRAYNLIWNEWFRDQNMQDSVFTTRSDGPDVVGNYVLLRRGKRHDYFTSSLPFPQKGQAVALPLGTTAPIVAIGDLEPTFNFASDSADYRMTSVGSPGIFTNLWDTVNLATENARWKDPKLQVDLTAASGATINELRQAFAIQKMFERDARGGTRYTEILRAHFGVTSPDSRLQRPEYLGGGSQPMGLTQVPNTTGAVRPMGDTAAYGITIGSGHSFNKSFTEHCIILGLVSMRADITYQQGIPRQFSRSTRFDFFWPALGHIGEQSVLNKEIFADGTANDDLTFGYQEKDADYRYKPSTITGKFRSNATGTLDAWHLSQNFGGLPVLNDAFIVENPPMTRILVVGTEPHIILDGFCNYICARPMATYGTPGFIDHF